ncbi:uncharacterized protein SCHCODRAFT_02568259 [Schizophyllum commune H4-8]|nr:uncharacterized protein SCHCODRAFT_02568259 [Schizophyllum commune H4-8]KAI5896092.1 hypothetical protein SCHCODRAFT_02568259 [Schizophyllum commune H4-8]
MAAPALPAYPWRTPKFFQVPDPEWHFGRPVTATEEGKKWMQGADGEDAFKGMDATTVPRRDLYQLMKSGIVPRPIAFVSTTSADGIDNIAPFSSLNFVTGVVSFFVQSGDNGPSDTLNNLRTGHGFVVSVISEPWVTQACVTGLNAPPGISEWALSGLTKIASRTVTPPRVKESAFSMECELMHTHEIRDAQSGDLEYTHVLGRVKYIHVRRDVLTERGVVDIQKLKPVAHIGDISYCTIGDVFRMRPSTWAEVEPFIPDEMKRDARGGETLLQMHRMGCLNIVCRDSIVSSTQAFPRIMSNQLPAYPWHTPQFVQVPDPEWKYGKPITATEEGKKWMEGVDEEDAFNSVDPATYPHRDLYQLMKSAIVPRPIAFVSTTSADGIDNIAPFSSLNFVTGVVSFFIQQGDHGPSDTLTNIRTGNGFVVSIISEPWIANAHAAGLTAPPGVSEWGFTGLTKVASKNVKPPRVKESAFSMECELMHTHEICDLHTGAVQYTHVLGRVSCIHVRRNVLTERGVVDIQKLKPVARIGDISYCTIGDIFRMRAPSWEEAEPLIPEELKRDAKGAQ